MEFFQFNGVSLISFVWCLCFFFFKAIAPLPMLPTTLRPFVEAEDNEKDQETHPPPVRWICQNEVQFLKTQRHWQSGCIDNSKARSWCQTPVFGAPRMQTSDFWELPVPRVKELKTLLLYSRSLTVLSLLMFPPTTTKPSGKWAGESATRLTHPYVRLCSLGKVDSSSVCFICS